MKPEDKLFSGSKKKKLAHLINEKNFYKLIADNTYDWEMFYDPKGSPIYVNQTFEGITGFNTEELLEGKISMRDVIHPDDYDLYYITFRETFNEKVVTDLHFRVVRKDKSIRYVNLYAGPVYQQEMFVGVRASLRDITDQKDFSDLQKLHLWLI